MRTNTRFINSVLKTAEADDTVMPWARGQRRKAFIEKRAQQEQKKRKTA
jgi:hypothetical protein